ncbi:hypothetical protein AAG906_004612 [Vitis piasezkii]
MIIDTLEVQDINSFSRLEYLKEVYGIIWMLVPIFTPVSGITIGVLAIVWLEREISTRIQQCIGPEYAGPLGILQALADGTNLLFKENLLPSRGNTRLFSIGPSIAVIPILLGYIITHFGSNLVMSNLNIGVFFMDRHVKYCYEIPLTTLCNLWRQPKRFIFFLISSLAECERLPSDLPESEEELVACYQTEYLGIKFGLFYIASYLNLLVSSLFVTILYLRGWDLSISYIFVPEFFEINKAGEVFGTTIGIFIILAKTYLFLFIPITTRWTLPRLRMDQLLNLGWKFLLPISLDNLLLTTSSQLLSL